MNLDFWQKPKYWPRDPLGYVFLARGFDSVGKCLFGETWKGVDKLQLVERLPQSLREANYPQQRRAHLVLEKHFQILQQPKSKTTQTLDISKPIYTFSEEGWAAAYQFVEKAFKHEQEISEQLKHIQQVIAEACEKGDLALATRNETTGKMRSLEKSIWNAELDAWGQRFDKCMINPKKPLQGGVEGPGCEWIFITTDSLEPFLKKLEKAKPTPQVKQTASGERQCEKWLIEQMRAHIVAPKAKQAYRETAQKEFSVGTRSFDRAWEKAKEAAERPNWGNPGRKRKS